MYEQSFVADRIELETIVIYSELLLIILLHSFRCRGVSTIIPRSNFWKNRFIHRLILETCSNSTWWNQVQGNRVVLLVALFYLLTFQWIVCLTVWLLTLESANSTHLGFSFWPCPVWGEHSCIDYLLSMRILLPLKQYTGKIFDNIILFCHGIALCAKLWTVIQCPGHDAKPRPTEWNYSTK